MKSFQKASIGLAAALGLAMLVPAGAQGTIRSSAAEVCTQPTAAYTFTVTITVASDGAPIATPSTNKNGTCVMGGDTIAFDTSNLPSGATWSATFPTPNGSSLFQNGCQFGNGTGQNSSCTVVASPPVRTYSYSVTVTVNGVSKTLDPHVIVGGSGKKRHHHHKAPTAQ
ncbi:MAG: hypothetical protein ACRD3T_21270, partial [Terriglobia bacterium]